jgi:hypothetical protein
MAGGDEDDFRAVEPLLEAVGKEVTYLGASGMGATMKLVLNMLTPLSLNLANLIAGAPRWASRVLDGPQFRLQSSIASAAASEGT